MRWAAWTSVFAGLWAIVAPFAIGYYTVNRVATTESVVIGILIGAFALWLAWDEHTPQYVDYVLGALGLWSVAAPFALAYRELTRALYSDVVVGVIVFVLAILGLYYRSHYGARTLTPKTT